MPLHVGFETWEVLGGEGKQELCSFLDIEIAVAAAGDASRRGNRVTDNPPLLEGLVTGKIGLRRLNNRMSVGTSVSEGVDTRTSNIILSWP